MLVATYILLILGLCGAVDILLYHSVSHGIRTHPDSRQELIVHSLRGPTYATLFVLVPNCALHGGFFWMLIALFAVDVGISIWDFLIERASREFLGGLPSGEYVLHMIMAMFFGGLVTSVCLQAGAWAALPTRLTYAPNGSPLWIHLAMAIMAVIVLYSGGLDAAAAVRLGRRPADRRIAEHGLADPDAHG